jgi:uncharacterized protein (DUF488 family)
MSQNKPIKIFTIGTSKKSAFQFFEALKKAKVKKLVDVRLHNTSQLLGFTKRNDLAYFLRRLASIDYVEEARFQPTESLLSSYQKKRIAWPEYEKKFLCLLSKRRVQSALDPRTLNQACLLCSEPRPDYCHRSLVCQYLAKHWKNIAIVHL